MEEAEKTTALKKAYADIILNTAKEAAARVMVSEGKVYQYHRDLSSTKEDALCLLLRFKHTMDSKINEAETKSLNRRRKIQELEAQLQEAEDIVGDLRAELNVAYVKLEEMAKNQMHSGPNMTEKAACEEQAAKALNALPEAVLGSQVKVSNAANGRCITNYSLEEYIHNSTPDIPPIIGRSKDPKLYRNGCTQRIHAYEGNPLNGQFSLSEEFDDRKIEKAVSEDTEGEMTLPAGTNITCIQAKKPVGSGKVRNVGKSSCKGHSFKSLHWKRKGAARYRRSNATICEPAHPMAKEVLPNLSSSQTCLASSNDILESLDNEGATSPSIAPSNSSEMGVLFKCTAAEKGDDEFTEAHSETIDEDREVATSLVLMGQQSEPGDGIGAISSNLELEIGLSSENGDTKGLETYHTFHSPLSNKRIKYTFQRKRKKEPVSSDDSSLLHQENPLKRKSLNKQKAGIEPTKSSIAAESSQHGQRMAPVARQGGHSLQHVEFCKN